MPTYNAMHTVLEAAINLILPCAEINLVMNPNYTIQDGNIQGANIRVECVVPMQTQPTSTFKTIAFSTPTEREDGSPLDGNDIAGYEIDLSTRCARARTLTKDGLKSVYSAEVCP